MAVKNLESRLSVRHILKTSFIASKRVIGSALAKPLWVDYRVAGF